MTISRLIPIAGVTFFALLMSGCVFMDDDRPNARGYTDCGTFLGGETCSPGQYCSEPQWSECSLGCLSDVNCASNQYCAKSSPNAQVGVCHNVRTSSHGLSVDAGGPGADAGGADAR